ncbi:nitrate/nitrite transporter NrtS [Ruegeria arenilitoris]|uniref:nitrate/nitrite transporter NrtS n=1 Tax=Ruegeria arenilitoris TaxID=1173585 RepID=UPI00147E4F85|nr:nitrate/nitrite transporter NrtS [Ruegeria arenilitoris]
MAKFLNLAIQPSVMRRAGRIALIIGSVFFLINYADKLIAGTITRPEIIKAMVSYCVPYCVSTYSSVMAVIESESA